MINIRKLAAVDMARFGTRLIVAEYALGIILPVFLGLISIHAGLFGPAPSDSRTIIGIWLLGIAANYVPLFIYGMLIARGGTTKEEGLPEFAHAKKYGVQQIMILVPLMVVIVTLVQEGRSPRQNRIEVSNDSRKI